MNESISLLKKNFQNNKNFTKALKASFETIEAIDDGKKSMLFQLQFALLFVAAATSANELCL